MDNMELTIQPLDTLFFRDGKPFARGDETWADSTFPPNPSVIYGAMRTALATVEGREIPFREVPLKLDDKTFSLNGIYFRKDGNNYLPLPLDLVEYRSESSDIKAGEMHKAHLLNLAPLKSILPKSKSFVKYLLSPNELAENIVGGLISETQLSKYLKGGNSEFDNIYKIADFIVSEPKVGIGRSNLTRTAEEGLLYRVDTKRLNGVEIRLIVNTVGYSKDDLNGTIVHFGGETKLVGLKKVGKDTLDIDNPNLKKGQFKIYLSTPAIFLKNGWKPDLEKFGIKANMVAACVGKPVSIGGYDLVNNKPKPMLKAVPAGSVYYYESDDSPKVIMEKIHAKSVSDYLPEQGFGIAYIGKFNKPD